MFKSLKNKLRRIQEGDEQIKKRWIIIMTILAMVAVLAIWIIYLNFTSPLSYKKAAGPSTENINFDWKNKLQQFQNIFNEAKNNIRGINQTTSTNTNGGQ